MDYKLGCSQSQNSLSVRARVSQSSLSMLESAQNTASAASRLIMVLFLWKWPRVLAKDEVGVCGMEAVSVQQLHGYQFLMKVVCVSHKQKRHTILVHFSVCICSV